MHIITPITLLFCAFIIVVAAEDFGYDGIAGPTYWGKKYLGCFGKHQSPINIEEHNVEAIKLIRPLVYEHFDTNIGVVEISNNGHTVVLTTNSKIKPIISGGPLLGVYEFNQLHFHWGPHDNEGSETTINNNSFPMELHMVFYQQSYGSFNNAVEHPDGLTVLSFLFANSNEENPNYNPLISALPKLVKSNTSITLNSFTSLDDLTTSNRSIYFTYSGSLTTPPCSEVVTWIEYRNTIPLTHDQIEAFRHLKDASGNFMSHNSRPTQPLHGRLIRMVHEEDVQNERLKSNSNIMQSSSVTLILLLVALML